MSYNSQYNYIITLSRDKRILIQDDRDTLKGLQIREITSIRDNKSSDAHETDIIAGAYSSHFSLIASAESSGLICLWNSEYMNLERRCIGHKCRKN